LRALARIVHAAGCRNVLGGGDARETLRHPPPTLHRFPEALSPAPHGPLSCCRWVPLAGGGVILLPPVLRHLEVHVARQRAAGCFHLDLAGDRTARYGGRDFGA
jgi:hypothetical protein